MEKPIESKQFGDFIVSLYYDDSPDDPRTWGQGDDLCPEILKQWAAGEVYGFVTTDKDGNEIDSCWGFYSFEEAYSAAKENFPTRNDQYYFDRYENQ